MEARTLGTRGFSRVRREFSKDLAETGNRARKVSGTQGRRPEEVVFNLDDHIYK